MQMTLERKKSSIHLKIIYTKKKMNILKNSMKIKMINLNNNNKNKLIIHKLKANY